MNRTEREETDRSLPMSIISCNVSEDMVEGTGERDLLYPVKTRGGLLRETRVSDGFGVNVSHLCRIIQPAWIAEPRVGSGQAPEEHVLSGTNKGTVRRARVFSEVVSWSANMNAMEAVTY